MLVVRVYRGRAGGREEKKGGVWLCHTDEPPPVSGMEASSKKRMKAELLTFGKGPLASD